MIGKVKSFQPLALCYD